MLKQEYPEEALGEWREQLIYRIRSDIESPTFVD